MNMKVKDDTETPKLNMKRWASKSKLKNETSKSHWRDKHQSQSWHWNTKIKLKKWASKSKLRMKHQSWIWEISIKLELDTETPKSSWRNEHQNQGWGWNIKVKFEIAASSLKMNWNTRVKLWNRCIKVKVEIKYWERSIKAEVETEASPSKWWNWSNEDKCIDVEAESEVWRLKMKLKHWSQIGETEASKSKLSKQLQSWRWQGSMKHEVDREASKLKVPAGNKV